MFTVEKVLQISHVSQENTGVFNKAAGPKKLQALRPATLLKRDSNTDVFL